MRICIEGPSAVGKTTLCKKLKQEYGAYIIHETIVKPIPSLTPYEQAMYYLDQELARWKLSEKINKNLVVFDSDPLKSLWFNWAYSYIHCLSLKELDGFFRDKIVGMELGFMDLYIVLNADDKELIKRKENDVHRARPEFEWVQRSNEYRNSYYNFIKSMFPENVLFIDARNSLYTFTQTIQPIMEQRKTNLYYEAYDQIISWLRNNTGECE